MDFNRVGFCFKFGKKKYFIICCTAAFISKLCNILYHNI